MKTSPHLFTLLVGFALALAPSAIAEPQNDEPPKRPMGDFRRGEPDGPRGEWGRGPGPHRGPGREGHLMKRIHNAADKNNDGKLDEEEKKEFDRLVGEAKQRMHKEILARFDADGDGKLSEEEHAKARAAGRKKMETLREEAIEHYDKDGDGELNEAERQEARQAVRQRMMDRTKEFDTNTDGILDETERAAAREAMGKERGTDAPPQRRPGFIPNQKSDRHSPPPQEGDPKREELRQRFDANKNGTLDDAELQTLRETIRKERANNAEQPE